jgi:hypothetical protein
VFILQFILSVILVDFVAKSQLFIANGFGGTESIFAIKE